MPIKSYFMMKEWQNEGGWDKYPPNPTRNRIVGKRGKGEIVYKRRGGATRKGIQQN